MAGRHTLRDGSTLDVTVNGAAAEMRGTDERGEAHYTVTVSLADAARLVQAGR
ncbi:hypothetical protein [Nocardiopsis alba]|uniref:hypothetical protein n=1 Tax=Nocardiopsis alba TaxID=53437 RepID=UPI003D74732E